MVTLLGFFFILGNVGLLEVFMPDLVGPVRRITTGYMAGDIKANANRTGFTMALLQFRIRSLDVSSLEL